MDHDHSHHHHHEESAEGYKSLAIILGVIAITSFLLALRFESTSLIGGFMLNFMAGFFLVFSAFKLLNIKEFAVTYATYDLIAKKVPAYGYIYPFIELSLGIIYALRLFLPEVNIAAFIIMFFSGIGVFLTVRQNKKFQCACLGSVIKLPLSRITLIEDFGMAAMALLMLFF